MDSRTFRAVPKTGVIYVMEEAQKAGYTADGPWSNLGQGAPETDAIEGAPPRLKQIEVDPIGSEYSPVQGALQIREAIADLYNQRYRVGLKSKYSAENVAISPGGRSGLTRIAAGLGQIHLGHFLPDYTAYEELLDLFRAFVPIPISLPRENGFAISPSELRRQTLGLGLGAILISNPCNPTGQLVQEDSLAKWLEMGRELQTAFIFDEFYSHYIYTTDAASHSAAAYVEDVNRDPVVILDGLTKNWRYPGLRLSWTLAPKEIIQRVSSAGSFSDAGAVHPVQKAAIPLLSKAFADSEAFAIKKLFSQKRNHMAERLNQMGIFIPPQSMPKGAFYFFANLKSLPPSLQSGMDFFRQALKHQVICVPGEFFDVDPGRRRKGLPSRLKHYVRLSFGPSMAELDRGLSGLKDMILRAEAN